MTARELLTAYRGAVMELQELELLPDDMAAVRRAAKRACLTAMEPQMVNLLSEIEVSRTYLVIRMYYQQAATDAAIAQRMHISISRVNQIRNAYIRTLTG